MRYLIADIGAPDSVERSARSEPAAIASLVDYRP